MIRLTKGNLLLADVEALVNTVNCVGYMGKGIALQFKKAYPENFKIYQKACQNEDVQPGRMCIFATNQLINPKFIVNFPTKRHWRGNSNLNDIKSGLASLVEEIKTRKIKSIAIPPLGCGYGGLSWNDVRPLIEKAFVELHDVDVLLFTPQGSPEPKTMPVGTKKPELTTSRASVIRILIQYSKLAYRLTLLEAQKLAYFLQEIDEPLKLKYEAGLYGPYAHNLNFLLESLEGHYIRGYGDNQNPNTDIEILPDANEAAEKFLRTHSLTLKRLNKVNMLIEGFETPYGMELLASVHWVVCHGNPPTTTIQETVDAIHGWNDRKKRIFKQEHIEIAWNRLLEEGWLDQ